MIPKLFTQPSQLHKNTALLDIPQSGVQIYSNYMLIDKVINSKNQIGSISNMETSEFSVSYNNFEQINKSSSNTQKKGGQNQLHINFNNSKYAFHADQQRKSIQIHNLAKDQQQGKAKSLVTQIHFKIIQSFMAVYGLLRKKLCEMGFDKKYTILNPLGKGATAEVVLVRRILDQKLFAAKIISIKDSSEKAYATFINQSKLLRILNHKHIVHLQSLYVHKKQLIQVLQYLNGGHLLNILKQNKIKNLVERWQVMNDLLLGLDHLRQKRIIHRDLKLENVMVRQRNGKRQFVITDFGLAIWSGQDHPFFHKCGTPGYIAPQILQKQGNSVQYTQKSDVFSLGVIAHLIFLHRPLFHYNGDIKQLLRSNRRAAYTLKDSFYSQLTSNQYKFLSQTLNKNPDKRPTVRMLLFNYFQLQKQIQFTKSTKKIQNKKIRAIDATKMGVQIKTEKQTSIRKHNLSLDIKKTETKQKTSEKQRGNSVKKVIKQFFGSFITPSPKKTGLKLKQNSLEKHKKNLQMVQ